VIGKGEGGLGEGGPGQPTSGDPSCHASQEAATGKGSMGGWHGRQDRGRERFSPLRTPGLLRVRARARAWSRGSPMETGTTTKVSPMVIGLGGRTSERALPSVTSNQQR
jgi:hypothetical protein